MYESNFYLCVKKAAILKLTIERELSLDKTLKNTSKSIDKDCTTISKEPRNHYKIKNLGEYVRNIYF